MLEAAGVDTVAGAVVGCLLALAVGFTMYGATNTTTLAAVLVDMVVTTIRMGIAGAVVQAVLTHIE